jgi:hypothetical protein
VTSVDDEPLETVANLSVPMAPYLATRLASALPSNPTTTWDAYSDGVWTKYGPGMPRL